MDSPWIAALSALFVWWFSTGAILWLVRRADNGGPNDHRWAVIIGAPLLFLGVAGLATSFDDISPGGVYTAFLSALAIWGWIELAFLCGVVTGPNLTPCPPGATQRQRFLSALGAIFWHEALLITALATMAIALTGADNLFGLWTFLVLFGARVSAKLNLFLGVPFVNVDFLPRPLAHLPSHFRRSGMNALFPASVTALTLAAAFLFERLHAVEGPGQTVGFALLATLTLLALLEHWFMVVPLPDEKLWRWMIPDRKSGG